ncbi:glutaminase A [Immundisolibacter sp.]|uniref:glutaminase A n=1 Tax=Immundisolibacter sp. TaxID=1934948 RepID=UPI000EE40ED5|nr:glutaminase A [Gammaproteobacteria bacterium]
MPEQSSDIGALVRGIRTAVSPFRSVLRELHGSYSSVSDGTVADYIPELAGADPAWFGIAAAGAADGQLFEAGHSGLEFTIQSIAKPFVFGLALEDNGRENVAERVGVEPTGDAFNSIIKLDEGSHRPHNPMVNAGAIATAALLKGDTQVARLNRLLDMFGRYIGRRPKVDVAVFASERHTGHRNRAIAHLLLNFGMLPPNVEEVLDLYFQACSVLVTARDLAMMAATLANGGVNPLTGERALQARYVQDVLSVMYTCGMYDYAGQWAYEVGLPAKSGVAGGVITVVPGRMGMAVFSPPLDSHGNSVRGVAVCRELSRRFGLHCFSSAPAADGAQLPWPAPGAATSPQPA